MFIMTHIMETNMGRHHHHPLLNIIYIMDMVPHHIMKYILNTMYLTIQ